MKIDISKGVKMRNRELLKLIGLSVIIAGLTMTSAACKARLKQSMSSDVVICTGISKEYKPYMTAQAAPKIKVKQGADEMVEEPENKLNLTENERYLLRKLAYAEAGNQDTKGKALVMLVVMNRVKDKRFPDTIHNVIYQKRQFSPVSSRKWNSFKPDKDSLKALELIENGYDESEGALYFESKSKSTWHKDNLCFLFKHQDHYFYK